MKQEKTIEERKAELWNRLTDEQKESAIRLKKSAIRMNEILELLKVTPK